jgi:hypothetical protein
LFVASTYAEQQRKRYREAGLEKFFELISPKLDEVFRTVYHDSEMTIQAAYQLALQQAAAFEEHISGLARAFDIRDRNWNCRPGNGVKDAHRILEKAAKFGIGVPKDMLGAKFIVETLEEAYKLAAVFATLDGPLQPVGFADRFVEPQKSGYRDLQFEMLFEGLIVEVKICHELMDELDSVEHKIYEIVRTLEPKKDRLNSSERMVLEQLNEISKRLYADAWNRVLERERGEL